MSFTKNTFLRVLPTLLLMMTAASPVLEAALKVYKTKGDVTFRAGNRWTALQRRAEVKPGDMLRIPSGGAVDILDTDTRRLYSSLSSGDISVKSLIEAAVKDAAGVTRKTNDRILASVSESGNARKSRFGSSGLSMHDTDAATSALTALDPSVPYLRRLMNLPADAPYTATSYLSGATSTATMSRLISPCSIPSTHRSLLI